VFSEDLTVLPAHPVFIR